MNREILFRGKREDNGEWVYGAFVPDALEMLCGADMMLGFIRRFNPEKHKMEVFEVERESVGQYTGLTDRNGVKIFEGDILKSKNELFVVKYGRCGGVQNVEREVGYVGFYVNPCGKDAEMLLRNGLRTDILYWLNSLIMEVRGNIHDNPELVNDSQE